MFLSFGRLPWQLALSMLFCISSYIKKYFSHLGTEEPILRVKTQSPSNVLRQMCRQTAHLYNISPVVAIDMRFAKQGQKQSIFDPPFLLHFSFSNTTQI